MVNLKQNVIEEETMTLDEVAVGSTCTVSKIAPLGDPIELTVRGYQLSLRKSDAASIVVQPA